MEKDTEETPSALTATMARGTLESVKVLYRQYDW